MKSIVPTFHLLGTTASRVGLTASVRTANWFNIGVVIAVSVAVSITGKVADSGGVGISVDRGIIIAVEVLPNVAIRAREVVEVLVEVCVRVLIGVALTVCAEAVADYKLPQRIEFMSELPKIASGKVDRRMLMESQ